MIITVFDLETTGVDKTKDQIIQIAALKIDTDTNKIIDELNQYIQPTGSYTISLAAYFKHNITPKFLSTYSSAIIGISLPDNGITTVLPTNSEYLWSFGLTAIATSPKIVSGLVVATIIAPDSPFSG